MTVTKAIVVYLDARREFRASGTNLHQFAKATHALHSAFADGAEFSHDAVAIAFDAFRAALADIQDGIIRKPLN